VADQIEDYAVVADMPSVTMQNGFLHRCERLLALRNDVGLLGEEYDPRPRGLVGNMPPAFSHVPLVREMSAEACQARRKRSARS
jgi:GH15 family glucan-1,4-alpha-glucosidase